MCIYMTGRNTRPALVRSCIQGVDKHNLPPTAAQDGHDAHTYAVTGRCGQGRCRGSLAAPRMAAPRMAAPRMAAPRIRGTQEEREGGTWKLMTPGMRAAKCWTCA